jgi:parallel beta-helix repeat protein
MKKLVMLLTLSNTLALSIITSQAQNFCSSPPTNATIISAGIGNHFSGFFTSNVLSGDVVILDDFTINSNFTFSNANVYVSPGVGIKMSSFELYVDNGSVLQTCDPTTMWQGIMTDEPNSKIFVLDGSTIQDAEFGILVSNISAEVHVDKSTFNRNYRHIAIVHGSGSDILVTNSKFYCRNNNGQPGDVLLTPWSGTRTSAGIFIYDAYHSNITIGVSGNGNIFENTEDAAIYSYWATVTVTDNIITNPINQISNAGIYAEFDGRLYAEENTISECFYGIYLLHAIYNFEIRNNDIFDIHNGIYKTNNNAIHYPATGSVIENNRINNVNSTFLKNGILVENTTGSFDIIANVIVDASQHHIVCQNNVTKSKTLTCNIARNVLTNTNHISKGIYVAELFQSYGFNYIIHDNIVNDMAFGIHALRLMNCIISDNDVTVMKLQWSEPSVNTYGVLVENSKGYNVSGNTVAGKGTNMYNDEWTSGYIFAYNLFFSKGGGNFIGCNKADNIGRGFSFDYYTFKTRFVENKMHDCYYQFYLKQHPYGLGHVGSPTNPWDNRWYSQTASGAKNTYSYYSNIGAYNGQTIFHVVNSSSYIPTNNDDNGFPAQSCNYLTNTVYNTPICGGFPIGIIRDEDIDDEARIAESMPGWEEPEWYSTYFLYTMIKTDTSDLLSGQQYQDIADSLDNTNIGLIYNIEEAVTALPFDSTQAEAVDDILGLLAELDPMHLIEENIKDYYEIYLNSYAIGEEVGNEQRERLHEIANSCPVEHGHAIYSARAFISMINPGVLTAYFNCDGGQNRESKQNNNLKTKIFVYPNPTNETLKISGLESDKSYKIIFYDLTGRIVLDQIITDSDVKLNNLHAGIYLYKITDSDYLISSGRISIVK